jgi:hypothetical protein
VIKQATRIFPNWTETKPISDSDAAYAAALHRRREGETP